MFQELLHAYVIVLLSHGMVHITCICFRLKMYILLCAIALVSSVTVEGAKLKVCLSPCLLGSFSCFCYLLNVF